MSAQLLDNVKFQNCKLQKVMCQMHLFYKINL